MLFVVFFVCCSKSWDNKYPLPPDKRKKKKKKKKKEEKIWEGFIHCRFFRM